LKLVGGDTQATHPPTKSVVLKEGKDVPPTLLPPLLGREGEKKGAALDSLSSQEPKQGGKKEEKKGTTHGKKKEGNKCFCCSFERGGFTIFTNDQGKEGRMVRS